MLTETDSVPETSTCSVFARATSIKAKITEATGFFYRVRFGNPGSAAEVTLTHKLNQNQLRTDLDPDPGFCCVLSSVLTQKHGIDDRLKSLQKKKVFLLSLLRYFSPLPSIA